MVGAVQAEGVMTMAAAEIGFAVAGVVHDRQPQHVLVVMLDLGLLDGVEGKKPRLSDFDWHNCVVSLRSQAPGCPERTTVE